MVSFLVLMPALLLPGVSADTTQVVMLVALLAGVLTFAEYSSAYPSLLEFRNAPPFNRMRFLFTLLVVVSVTMISRGAVSTGNEARAFLALGQITAQLLDFPFSPVRLMTLVLPLDAPSRLVATLRLSASLAYALALIMVLVFFVQVRLRGWPARNGAFNVWINLPLFDPTGGGDVVTRLRRDARVNFSLGFLLPFLLPAFAKAATDLMSITAMENPQTLVWTITLWAMFPAMLITRGLAMVRIADMIETKRRRAYAQAEGEAVGAPQSV
jgi:hypothetical protein